MSASHQSKKGSSYARRARKQWMLNAFGDGQFCRCTYCPDVLTYDTVQADRIVPGGSYARSNIQPACGICNNAKSDDKNWLPTLTRQHVVDKLTKPIAA